MERKLDLEFLKPGVCCIMQGPKSLKAALTWTLPLNRQFSLLGQITSLLWTLRFLL